LGLQNQTTRVWSKTGARPRVVKQKQFEYGYLFGTVCLTSGQPKQLNSRDVYRKWRAYPSSVTPIEKII